MENKPKIVQNRIKAELAELFQKLFRLTSSKKLFCAKVK